MGGAVKEPESIKFLNNWKKIGEQCNLLCTFHRCEPQFPHLVQRNISSPVVPNYYGLLISDTITTPTVITDFSLKSFCTSAIKSFDSVDTGCSIFARVTNTLVDI